MGGTSHHRAMITCGYCGVVSTARVNHKNGQKEEHLIRQRLQQVGWFIGKRESAHRCPGCYSAIKVSAKRKSMENEQVANEQITAVAHFPPKAVGEMTRDDRRIIFEKLNEIYIDEKAGYSDGWTDAKVASDLGIARAWVSRVREEMFGPEAANGDIRKAVEEAKATLAECRKLAEMFTPLLGRADKIEKTLVEIERGLR